MNAPKVSIIIPVYNTENYIESCVKSALEQSYSNFELICVDNNSTDDSLKILRELEKKFSKLKVLVEKEQGAPAARNTGLAQATGEWVQFLDSDDLLLPQKIEHQIEILKSCSVYPDIIVGGYFVDEISERNRYIVYEFSTALDALVNSFIGCTCSNLWRKNALSAIKGWRVGLKSSQERDLFFRLVKNDASAIADNKPLTIVRQRTDGSISANDKQGNIERVIGVLSETYDYLSTMNGVEEKKTIIKDTIFGKLRELTNYDIESASRFYSEIFPDAYLPNRFTSTTPLMLKLIKIFGFRNAHRIRNILKRV